MKNCVDRQQGGVTSQHFNPNLHILSVYCDTGEEQGRNEKEYDGFAEILHNVRALFAMLSIQI